MRHVSANAILSICQECRKQLINDLDQIIQATLWLDQMEAGSEAAQCLLKGLYVISNKILFYFAILASSKLISRLTSTDDIHRYLKLLFDQQIQSLTEVCSFFNVQMYCQKSSSSDSIQPDEFQLYIDYQTS